MSSDEALVSEASARITLFGYFCVEQDEQETILARTEPTGKWAFPINTEFDRRVENVSEAVSQAVTDFCQSTRLLGPAELLASNLSFPTIHKVLIGPSSRADTVLEGTTGYFFKVKLRECFGNQASIYKWSSKLELFASPERCLDELHLDAINRSMIYTQFGFKIVECVDVLVFRINNDRVEFLLLKREDPIRAFVGREYPKGPVLFHETVREGALHRLTEETGTTEFEYRGYLGYQVVDVRDRKLKEYDTLRVHGLTFLYTGAEENIHPTDRQVVLRNPIWVSWEEARSMIWMKPYGPVFFDRWLSHKTEILEGLSGPE